jgi:hypothetical protein
MEIQSRPAISPSIARFIRWGLHGGALAALVPLLYGVAVATGWSGDSLVILAGGMVLGGGLPTGIVLALRRRQDRLAHVERDLVRAYTMMEQRLIDKEDYQRLKQHTLEIYRAGPGQTAPVWSLAFWGAVVATAILSLIAIEYAGSYLLREAIEMTIAAALAGGSVVGGVAQAYVALTGSGARAGLPAPAKRHLLDE